MVRQDKFTVGSWVTEVEGGYCSLLLSTPGMKHQVLAVRNVPWEWHDGVGHTQWLTVHFPERPTPSEISGAYFNPL